MFGYVRPLTDELKVCELHAYKGCYCGVCRAIGARSGQLARMLLRYDCAFLAAIVGAETGETAYKKRRCLFHPFRGKRPVAVSSPAVDYAADVNVLLGWHALNDRRRDDGSVIAAGLCLLLRGARKRAAKARPALDAEIARCLLDLAAIERRTDICTDEPSDVFGRIMRAVAEHAPLSRREDLPAWQWMFYNLGRWIYLIDAWDDLPRDRKRGAFNPFLTAGDTKEDAAFLLHMSLLEAEKGYDLATFSGPHGLTDNILKLGCRAVTEAVLDKTKEIPVEGNVE